jgi:hypothetical protein
MVWSELESGLIQYARIDCVMLLAEKHRSMVDGLSPLC